ncbi:hypothetical protein Sste5346_005200 [Sporothrix stenoceras]|uniref:Mitochondrial zinc maintenance protein 1, mitochondrial n=1 Tax=Sporothrix stenoceras TaxID=5173 RepID=A0ABR3Z5Q3_9PEZI
MPGFFIPARNSRHRTACFALYKALIQRARQVTLPEHVAYREPDKPYVHPIHRFVRHSFQQNKPETSPRLVFAALKAGYKFIKLLDAAKTPDSIAHKQVVSYLEKRRPPRMPPKNLRGQVEKREKQRAREARRATREAGGFIPGETDRRPPLLVRQVVPGSETMSRDGILTHLYEYVPGNPPRPLEEIPGGVRPVPVFTTESNGIPFLRMGKPQSPILSRALRIKGKKRRTRAQLASLLMRDELEFVGQEDIWENNLLKVAEEEAPRDAAAATFVREMSDEPTYRHSVAIAVAYINSQLNIETADMLARSRGMLKIIDRERTLAEQEAKEREAKQQQEGHLGDKKAA